MGFELGGAGAGAAFGLEELLTRQRAEQMLREQIAFRQMQQSQLHDDRQARLAQTKLQSDALQEARQQANADRIFKENQTLNQSIPGGQEIPGDSPILSRLQSLHGTTESSKDLAL